MRRVASASRARSCSRTSRRSARGSRPVWLEHRRPARRRSSAPTSWRCETLTPTRQALAAGQRRATRRAARQARSSTRRPSGTISPVSSAIGTNSAGLDRAAVRAVPARERLEADDPAGRRLHDRLVEDARAASASIAWRRSVSRSSRRITRSCMRASKTAWRPLPSAFARYIATSASRITSARRGVGVGERDADRGGDHQLAAVEVERVLQRLLDALGDHGRLAGVADVVEQDRELVAAEPGDGVAGPQGGLQPARDRDQQPVADVVAERVVDELEAVEVEEQHRRAGGRARGAARGRIACVEAVEEQHAVGQPGQRVVERVVLEALLGLAAVGDVGLGADDARGAAVRGRAPRCRARASSGRRRRGAGSGARTRSAGSRRRGGPRAPA